MEFDKFTENSIKVVQNSQNLAVKNNNPEISQIHIMYCLLTLENSLIYELLKSCKVELNNLIDKLEYEISKMSVVTGIQNIYLSKYANQEIVNHLRSLGNILIIEPSNVKQLQKRVNKTEKQDKESTIKKKDGTTQTIRKFKRKKRFGTSILNRAPGQLTANCKLKFDDVKIVDKMFRASQYDHTANTYIKQKLNDRMFNLFDGTLVQS